MQVPDFSGKVLRERYQIVQRIGYGGMATVYEALDLQLEKRVAVKVLNPQFSQLQDYILRFRQEAMSAAKIRHAQLVDVTDFGTDGGLVYFVMELLHGESLGERIHREAGPIPWTEMVAILTQVCDALACAHEHGVIHRDVKPGNVFLVAQPGRAGIAGVKLLDLGVAKVVRDALNLRDAAAPETRMSQGTPGTPEYMAPEQAMGRDIDHRIDVYALGVMMYRMLTGHLPFFSPKSSFEVLRMHVELSPVSLRQLCPDAQIPAGIEAVVLKALAKRPEERYDTTRALSEALLQAQNLELGRGPLTSTVRTYTSHASVEVATRRSLAHWLVLPSTLFAGLTTAGVFFMLLMLVEIPGVKAFAGTLRGEPQRQASTRRHTEKSGERRAPPPARPVAPPAVVAPPPVVAAAPAPPPVAMEAPVDPPMPTSDELSSPTDHSSPGTGSAGNTNPRPGAGSGSRPGSGQGKPSVPGPSPAPSGAGASPPRDAKASAKAAVLAARNKVGQQCKGGRPDTVDVSITVDLAANKVSAQLTGRQNTAATCVKGKLEALKPLKKAGQGVVKFDMKVPV